MMLHDNLSQKQIIRFDGYLNYISLLDHAIMSNYEEVVLLEYPKDDDIYLKMHCPVNGNFLIERNHLFEHHANKSLQY